MVQLSQGLSLGCNQVICCDYQTFEGPAEEFVLKFTDTAVDRSSLTIAQDQQPLPLGHLSGSVLNMAAGFPQGSQENKRR